ncbi:MAG: NAD(P)H-dependent oxidoreductase [Candidatus Nanopelagicales bacterium]
MIDPIKIVAIGGTTRPNSSSEKALRIAARAAQNAGAQVCFITGSDLILPIYETQASDREERAMHLVQQVRGADGLLVSSPGYHGGMSGLIKNAIDYLEDLNNDARPYLHGRAVGCIASAYGWQASVTTLHQLRQVTHALRGWPTPMGGAINSQVTKFDESGESTDAAAISNLELIGTQVVEFAQAFRQPKPLA